MKYLNTALDEKDTAANELLAQVPEQDIIMKPEDHTTPEPLLLSTPPAETEPSQLIYTISPEEDIQIHQLAAAFPLTEGKAFDQIKDSIRLIGQQVPVIMHNGVLLDGRNRLRACRELGRSVKAVDWNGTGTPEKMILAMNLRRSHFTTGQKAAVAVKLLPSIELQADERSKAGKAVDPSAKLHQGRSNDLAGEQVGVSSRSVAKAKKIKKASPDIFHQLFIGQITIGQAEKMIKQPSRSQSPSGSLKIALMEIIKLVPDHNKEQFNKIVKECPTLKKALDSFAEDKNGDAK